MKESTPSVSPSSSQRRLELEMLYAVLEDDAVYPWSPTDPVASAYYDALETVFEPGRLSQDIFVPQWERLSRQVNTLWSLSPETLEQSLGERFGDRIPSSLLSQLAARAAVISEGSLSLIDQLVDCVQSVLPNWAIEDLQVMARPLALSMRNGQGEAVEATLRSVRQVAWADLSELEQARLSLAVARCALAEAAESSVSPGNEP